MTREEIKAAIYNIISNIVPDEDLDSMNDNKEISEQIELDSMDFLDVVMELRKQYKVDVPEKDYLQLASINSCVDYLEPKLKDR